ncbi:hypothetical protein PGT21_012503 [Puccinia graminis f. sp. tritici]|uniref:Uncharacterized protein n=1 Tax=Puccinia graminis f. sp. tritici TaxID=56615 RepID=A0A5B0LQG5_PUCGR|nr:hypothetical protein PGT21_012503 [Puccinia graminis f. sp. tritici]
MPHPQPTLAKPDDPALELGLIADVEMETLPTKPFMATSPSHSKTRHAPFVKQKPTRVLKRKPTRVVKTLVPLNPPSTPAPQKKPDPEIGAASNHSPLELFKLPKQRPTFQPEETQLLLNLIESEPDEPITHSSWQKVATLINKKFEEVNI